MKALTRKRAEAWLRGDHLSCPFCGERDELEWEGIEAGEDRTYQRASCGLCGGAWHEGYTLDSIADDGDSDFFYLRDPVPPRHELVDAVRNALAEYEMHGTMNAPALRRALEEAQPPDEPDGELPVPPPWYDESHRLAGETTIEEDLLAACRAVLKIAGDNDLPDNGEFSGAAITDQVWAAVARAEGRGGDR